MWLINASNSDLVPFSEIKVNDIISWEPDKLVHGDYVRKIYAHREPGRLMMEGTSGRRGVDPNRMVRRLRKGVKVVR